jgi:hypothetical protein
LSRCVRQRFGNTDTRLGFQLVCWRDVPNGSFLREWIH